MNQIKFRAWDTHQNKMITKFMIGSNTDPDSSEWTCPIVWMNNEWVNHDGLIILQFTGLQDKDGVDIYVGDIVLCYPDEVDTQYIRVVESDNNTPDIGITTNGRSGLILCKTSTHLIQIIGNIHQNPELIK
jgi:uncharacterized phage protein (TIGR01671 family)